MSTIKELNLNDFDDIGRLGNAIIDCVGDFGFPTQIIIHSFLLVMASIIEQSAQTEGPEHARDLIRESIKKLQDELSNYLEQENDHVGH